MQSVEISNDIGTDIFLCTPDNVEVAGSITDHIENMEHSFD